MELRDIEYFAIVAEQRHLGRAADALGLTQPALSKSLRRLEAALGAKLVRRTSKGVELTAEGAALAGRAHLLRLSLDDVAREVRDVSHGRVGNLRIGAAPSVADHVLSASCAALLSDAPQVAIKMTVGNNDVLLPALRNGDLDLIVSGIPDPPREDLIQEHLYDDEFVVFGSARHPLAARGNVSLAELSQVRWTTAAVDALAWQWLRRRFESRGLPAPRVALEVSANLLRGLVAGSSDLLCFTARRAFLESVRHVRLAEIPVKELKWVRRVGVSYRKGAYRSPTAQRFIGILKEAAREIATENRDEKPVSKRPVT